MEQSRGAAWRRLLLLTLLLSLSLAAAAAVERQQAGSPGTVRCLNSYGSQKRRVDCVWHPNQALGDGPFYLNFSDLFTESSSLLCKLLASSSEMPPVSSCSVTGEGEFMENDQYHVSLHDASLGTDPLYTIFSDYEPMKHIQSDPPLDLESSMSASKCRIQWKRPEAYGVFLETVLQWELAFKAADAPWEQAQSKILDYSETWVELEGAEFKSSVSYVARIRCKISDPACHYRSEWSPWSPTTTWTSPPPGDLLPWLGAVLTSLPLCLGGALVLLLLGLRSWARTQGRCWGKTPTPATFFQPLYAAHRGDFKHWIGLEGAPGLPRGSEPSASSGDGGGAAAGHGGPPKEPVSQLSFFKQQAQGGPPHPQPGAPHGWHEGGLGQGGALEQEPQMPHLCCPHEAGGALLASGRRTSLPPPDAPAPGPGWAFLAPGQEPCGASSFPFPSSDYCTFLGLRSSSSSSSGQGAAATTCP